MLLTSLLLATAQPVAPLPADRAAERALFKQIVEMQTVAGKPAEFRKLTSLLTAEFRKAGMTTIIKDHDNTQTLIARWKSPRSSGKKPILLLAHMDVVEAKAADWKNPPFQFREENGFYLGRGSSDNKAALTGLVLALQKLKASGWTTSRDLVVLFTGDEETGMKSVKRASTEWRDLIDAEYALNFDAGGGARYRDGRIDAYYLQIAEKTYADFKLTAVNEGGHSSAPPSRQRHLRPCRRAQESRGTSLRAEDQSGHPRLFRADCGGGQGQLRRTRHQMAGQSDRSPDGRPPRSQ